MGPSSKTCLLIITIQVISIISAQETGKRVPQGFLGVRGKKYMPDDVDPVLAHLMYSDQGDKLDEEYSKRAPMGFMGMRGKKGDEVELIPKRDGSLIGQIDYSKNDLSNSDFPLLDELLNAYLRKITGQSEINEVEKRAANMNQFYGVRGKKSYDKRPFDLNFRGKFIGVRGKKDAKNNGAKEIKFLLNPNEPWPKRKGQMGFFGMRGKKWMYESNSESEQTN